MHREFFNLQRTPWLKHPQVPPLRNFVKSITITGPVDPSKVQVLLNSRIVCPSLSEKTERV